MMVVNSSLGTNQEVGTVECQSCGQVVEFPSDSTCLTCQQKAEELFSLLVRGVIRYADMTKQPANLALESVFEVVAERVMSEEDEELSAHVQCRCTRRFSSEKLWREHAIKTIGTKMASHHSSYFVVYAEGK